MFAGRVVIVVVVIAFFAVVEVVAEQQVFFGFGVQPGDFVGEEVVLQVFVFLFDIAGEGFLGLLGAFGLQAKQAVGGALAGGEGRALVDDRRVSGTIHSDDCTTDEAGIAALCRLDSLSQGTSVISHRGTTRKGSLHSYSRLLAPQRSQAVLFLLGHRLQPLQSLG
ncbi:hypothetical protein LDO31_14595 [Luteimonas sp. XNQY3]|nr:hypothetical protein [Luteimonas sp. XNQY3]MCD9007446.1 hypothetical protein [Luteimonas sp. XNQY3]